jgi:hypothetical protein
MFWCAPDWKCHDQRRGNQLRSPAVSALSQPRASADSTPSKDWDDVFSIGEQHMFIHRADLSSPATGVRPSSTARAARCRNPRSPPSSTCSPREDIGVVVLAKNGESRLRYDSVPRNQGRRHVGHPPRSDADPHDDHGATDLRLELLNPWRRGASFHFMETQNRAARPHFQPFRHKRRGQLPTAPSAASIMETSCSTCFSETKPRAVRRTSICAASGNGGRETVPLLGPGARPSFESDERRHDSQRIMAQSRLSACASRSPNPRPRGSGMWNWRTPADTPVTCDLIHTQDIGIAHYGAVRLNEHYVSQYIDHTPLEHPSKGAPSPRARTSRWADVSHGR